MNLGNNSSVDAFASVNVWDSVLIVKSFLCISISLVLFVR